VVEQVLGGEDSFGREHFRHPGTNAAHVHDGSIEAGHTLDAKTFGVERDCAVEPTSFTIAIGWRCRT
jgi:hypothetical protein